MIKASSITLNYTIAEIKQLITEKVKEEYPKHKIEVDFTMKTVYSGYGSMESYETILDKCIIIIKEEL